MTTDIVARLRQTHRVGCECVGCEAAAEIERLRELLGNTEQLEMTVARLTEDLRRMDAIVALVFVSIEKRKLREAETV